MSTLNTAKAICLAILCLTISCSISKNSGYEAGKKYVPEDKQLYNTIATMDSLLFDAFNKRDLEKQKEIFSTNVEFYHDQGGVTNYDQLIENTRRIFTQNNGLKRTLIPGSVEVYPIKDYGAIEIGSHRFCHPESGKDDCGTFKFVHIWQKINNEWKLTRVISYGH